jgi:hypothetical protein
MSYITNSDISTFPKAAKFAVVLVLFLCGTSQNGYAEHINFREKDMRTIVVGEQRENEIFYGCMSKQAAVELSILIDQYGPWTIEKIMADKEKRAQFGGDNNCDEHTLESVTVSELLYLADQKRGEDKIGRDGEVYFGTRYSSILKAISNTGNVYFMLANQLVDGEPTEQAELCMQVLHPVCP